MAATQPRIEIMTHCWAGRHDHYAKCLAYQIASLILHPPKRCHVTHMLVFSPDDPVTMQTSLDMQFLSPDDDNITWMAQGLPTEQLGRRCIGRNMAAKHSIADLVWFTDCDYLFRGDVLDRLAEMEWPEGASMVYPRRIRQNSTHAAGDRTIEKMDEPKVLDIDPADFVEKRFNRAIGGVQIVRGDFAREHGYLSNDPKWQKPLNKPTFVSCRCDRAYRKRCEQNGPIVGVDLPGVYRIRHTATTHHEQP